MTRLWGTVERTRLWWHHGWSWCRHVRYGPTLVSRCSRSICTAALPLVLLPSLLLWQTLTHSDPENRLDSSELFTVLFYTLRRNISTLQLYVMHPPLKLSGLYDNQPRAIITPLLKKQTADPTDVRNYSPLSNLTFTSKVVERSV